MRGLWVIVVLAGCDPYGETTPTPPLRAGFWELSISSLDDETRFPAWYEIEPDGRAAGRDDVYLHAGQLGELAIADITLELNTADVLDQWDCWGCSGPSAYEIEITRTDDAAGTRWKRFRASTLPGSDDAIYELIASVREAIVELPSDECSPELDFDECYDAAPGATTFCRGPVKHTCDAAGVGDVVDCPALSQNLECDDELGWMPAISWSLTAATVTRRDYVPATPYSSLQIDWTLQVTNRDAQDFATTVAPAFWQFEHPGDPDGFALPFELADCTVSTSPGDEIAAPGSSRTYAFSASCLPSSALAYGELELLLRKRPFDQLPLYVPFLPAVPVTIVDERTPP